ncbi:pyridoxamine 5'-phosphate oxidase family protein [Paraoerskovia marina]|uniref:pyridoxamine 5'-phosphate oxidase family protein n=1 Tax=Paraoerskovia marina TaxID=545619 RepID=UPI000492DD61|nr:pyridoxamine 5'-phosphate oxidase family protein [Paraoerskovia marina]
MPLTNPWLDGPTPTGRLPRERLEERIANLLSTQNMAVIATVDAEGAPAATPVRYYHLGFELMFTAAPRSPKMRNLAADPRISVGVFAPLVGQASSRGAQLFGTARVIARDEPEAEAYWEAFRWQSDHVERGRDVADPPADPLTVVTPERIVYTEHWLRRDGFSPRQFWRRDADAARSALG